MENVRIRDYLDAIERKDAEALGGMLTADVEHHEHPNRFTPAGAVHDRQAMLAGLARGAALLAEEHYEVRDTLTVGERVACRMQWRATTAIPMGEHPAGLALQAALAVFFTFRDGRIARIETYDCVAPFGA